MNNTSQTHAEEWIAGWNAHDIDAIAGCLADGALLVASDVARRWRGRQESLRGKPALREHFTRRLELAPNLELTREVLLVTPRGYALLYRRENGGRALKTIELDGNVAARVTVFNEHTG